VSLIQPEKRPIGLSVFLIVAGALGLWAAFSLTLDKFEVLLNPNAKLSCSISPLVECATNLKSHQGSAFGFPNPLIGLMGFVTPIAVGVAILAGARFARWFWIIFNIGIAGALAFVIWLIVQSIYVLGTLCVWCMLVWAMTIPMFLLVTVYNLKIGNIPIPAGGRRFFARAYGWMPLLTFVLYVVIFLLAQTWLDVVHRL
jgi:uncharacterized membrane protein